MITGILIYMQNFILRGNSVNKEGLSDKSEVDIEVMTTAPGQYPQTQALAVTAPCSDLSVRGGHEGGMDLQIHLRQQVGP